MAEGAFFMADATLAFIADFLAEAFITFLAEAFIQEAEAFIHSSLLMNLYT